MTTATIDLLVHPFYGMGLLPPYYTQTGEYDGVQGLATSPLLRTVDVIANLSIEKIVYILKQSEEKSEWYKDMLKWLWQERIKKIRWQEHTFMGFLFSEPRHPRITPHQEALVEFAQTELGDRLVGGSYGESDVYDRLVQLVHGYDEAAIYAFGEVSSHCVRTEGLLLSKKLTDAKIRNEPRCHQVLCADLPDGKEQALAVYRTLQAQGAA